MGWSRRLIKVEAGGETPDPPLTEVTFEAANEGMLFSPQGARLMAFVDARRQHTRSVRGGNLSRR